MNLMNRILRGDALAVLRRLPDESVDCIMTSPPYWGLRDYGVRGQLGQEPTLDEYLDKLLLVTAELRRVLKPAGTMFWNHGDSYGTGSGAGVRAGTQATNRGTQTNRGWQEHGKAGVPGYQKSLLLQAHRLAVRMVDEQGWILRNIIVWHKPNAMPSSVKDRFGVDYDSVFFFTKSKQYFFEPQFEKTAATSWSPFNLRVRDAETGKSGQYRASAAEKRKYARKRNMGGGGGGFRGHSGNFRPDGTPIGVPGMRGMRSVWTIPTAPFPEAHFATFPEKLAETPLRAGCPERVCAKCGAPWPRVIRKTPVNVRPHVLRRGKARRAADGGNPDYQVGGFARTGVQFEYAIRYAGYEECGCGAGWRPGVVLDPFFGSGTTGLTALKLSRHFIGIELNPAYVAIAERRIKRFLADRNLIPLPSDAGMADGGLREAA